MPSSTIGTSNQAVDVQNVIRYVGVDLCPTSTSAISVSGRSTGVVGQANDTCISQVFIPLSATATTVTLGGFAADETGASKTIVLTGQVTVDTIYLFGSIVNTQGPATVTASAAHGAHIWINGAI